MTGIFAPITTPFTAEEDVDFYGLEKNMSFYAASGLHGFLVLGSNGENKSLDETEKLGVLRTVIRAKGSRQAVMAGCIYETTRHSVEFAKKAADAGCDCVTLLPPSYFKKQMHDDVLFRYFADIADASPVPCLLYNAPQFSAGTVISAELIARIREHPNILGIKDSGGKREYLDMAGRNFSVMAGSANFLMDIMYSCDTGGVVSLANFFPEVVLSLYDNIRKSMEGNTPRDAIYLENEKMIAVNNSVSGRGGVAAVKYAMDLAGLCGGLPRMPLPPLAPDAKRLIKTDLKNAGLL